MRQQSPVSADTDDALLSSVVPAVFAAAAFSLALLLPLPEAPVLLLSAPASIACCKFSVFFSLCLRQRSPVQPVLLLLCACVLVLVLVLVVLQCLLLLSVPVCICSCVPVFLCICVRGCRLGDVPMDGVPISDIVLSDVLSGMLSGVLSGMHAE